MRDRILESWLSRQKEEGLALAADSDLLALYPDDGPAPQRYYAMLRGSGLVRMPNGDIRQADRFDLGVFFARDYLRRVDPVGLLTLLGPPGIFHPNVSDKVPVICIGEISPGTPLTDLLYRVFDVLTYKRMTVDESNALNHAACQYARGNQHRFPVDPRPLKRRAARFRAEIRRREARP